MTHKISKIIHVDDDPVMRLMTKKALERSGLDIHVLSYASGQELLASNIDIVPDILLIDMKMPIMNGETLVRKIREGQYPYSKAPVVFVTGLTEKFIQHESGLEPVIGVVQKPFSTATFLETLQKYLDDYTK